MATAVDKGILGRKIGMTQIFRGDGTVVPVTVLEAGPCPVIQVKSKEKDGYEAVQVGFLRKKVSRVNKPLAGHFAKYKLNPTAVVKEIRLKGAGSFNAGDSLTADLFKVGDRVDVAGTSKGHGFAGGVKRHGWKGGGATHGSMFHRAVGSIGASSDPSRVFKGKTMPGHMGAERVTVQNLEIVEIKGNYLFVKGAVPGARKSLVTIRNVVKGQ